MKEIKLTVEMVRENMKRPTSERYAGIRNRPTPSPLQRGRSKVVMERAERLLEKIRANREL